MPFSRHSKAAQAVAASCLAIAFATPDPAPAATFKTLHAFLAAEGQGFASGLTIGRDGILYGIRGSGPLYAFADKELTVLANSGGSVEGGLVKDAEGNLYGTTAEGGQYNYGTIFKVTPDGTLTTLYEFAGGADGYYPNGNLILDKSGDLYGVTAGAAGNVFELTPDGSLITLHTFDFTDGQGPQAPLLLGPNQILYGATSLGGPDDNGTLFQVSLKGDFKTLFLFSREQGRNILGGLLRDGAGTLYGVTPFGGSADDGAIFSLTSNGTFTTLHSFSGEDGQLPDSGLYRDKNGTFYGTTYSGGQRNDGVIFSLTTNQTFAVLHSFSGNRKDGEHPYSAVLVPYKKDSLVGTTSAGGQYGNGTIFEITP